MSVKNVEFKIKDPSHLDTRAKKRQARMDPIYEEWKGRPEYTEDANGNRTFNIRDDDRFSSPRKRRREREKIVRDSILGLFGFGRK